MINISHQLIITQRIQMKILFKLLKWSSWLGQWALKKHLITDVQSIIVLFLLITGVISGLSWTCCKYQWSNTYPLLWQAIHEERILSVSCTTFSQGVDGSSTNHLSSLDKETCQRYFYVFLTGCECVITLNRWWSPSIIDWQWDHNTQFTTQHINSAIAKCIGWFIQMK